MAIGQEAIDELKTDIDAINANWLAVAEFGFTAVEDGLFEAQPLFKFSKFTVAELLDDIRHFGMIFLARGIPEITRMIVDAYSKGSDWSNSITPTFKQRCTWARRRATQDFLVGTGRGLPAGYRLDGWAFADKEQRAIDAVGMMRDSFNRKLPLWVESVKSDWIAEQGSLRGLNRNSMASRLRTKIEAWHAQYNEISAITELNTQYDQQLRELVARNDVDPIVTILPEMASDRCRWGCPDLAGREMLFSESPEFPLHPNCIHSRQIKAGSFALPLDSTVDLGGPTLYFPRNLPEI